MDNLENFPLLGKHKEGDDKIVGFDLIVEIDIFPDVRPLKQIFEVNQELQILSPILNFA